MTMNKRFEQTLLYDFYGELLTDKQKLVCERYYLEDLSLGEISEELEISRQGVHDALKRSEKLLFKYEEKLKLVERFMSHKNNVEKIIDILDSLKDNSTYEEATLVKIDTIRVLAKEVLENY